MTIKKPKKRLFKKKKKKLIKEKKKTIISHPRNTLFRRYEIDIIFIILPIILAVIFVALFIFNSKLSKRNQEFQLVNSNNFQIADYPVISAFNIPILSARAASVIDKDSKRVIFAKNDDVRFSMASTAKIMTALVALEKYKLDSILTIKSDNIGGSMLGLLPGEQYSFENLLYAMMMSSANDAAVAIVDNYPGGKQAFISAMNNKAREYHLDDTSFFDPTGLDDDGNFTTSSDLARLGALAIENKKLSIIVNTHQKKIADVKRIREIELKNLNRLLGYKGVNGIKTGTTEGAGEVLITSALIHDHTFIIVVMNSTDRFADTDQLLNLISDKVKFKQPSLKN